MHAALYVLGRMDKWDLHLPLQEPGHNTSHVKKRFVVDHRFLVTRGHPTIVLHTTQKTLDLVAFLVELAIIEPFDFAPLAAGNHRLGLQRDDLGNEGIAVIAFVGKHRLDGPALLWSKHAALEQGLGLRDIMALTRRYGEGQRVAQGIGDNVDLAREAAPRAA